MTTSSKFLTYYINQYLINSSNTKLNSGKILSSFQESLLTSRGCKYILVTAPTGAGKTLGYLLRSKEYSLNVIVYPSNELIWDQVKAIGILLENEMDEHVAIAYERKREVIRWEKDIDENTTCILYAINGESLSSIAENERLSQGSVLVKDLEKARNLLNNNVNRSLRVYLLTNLSFLLLLQEHAYTKSQRIDQLLSILGFKNKGALLIIDEFHSYFAHRLALLLYSIRTYKHLFSQIVMTSATPSKASDIITERDVSSEEENSNTCIIKANKGTDRIIRHKTTLSIRPIPSGFLIYEPNDIESIENDVVRIYENNRAASVKIKVLVIVNSIVTCEQLFKRLYARLDNNNVSRIHGLITDRARRGAIESEVVIGTSAIELGVDFDIASIVFEANDSSSFIQRFGRVSRQREGTSIAYVPATVLPEFESRLGTASKIDYDQFVSAIKNSMHSTEVYADFVKSKEAALLLAGILYSTSKRMRPEQDPQTLILKALRENPHYISSDITSKICEVVSDRKQWRLIRKLGKDRIVAGFSISFPAYFIEFDAFDYVTLQDIPRIEFTILDKRKQQLPNKPPLSMKNENEFLYIKSIKSSPTKLYAIINGISEGKVCTLTEENFNLVSEGQLDHCEWIATRLVDHIAYLGSSYIDWRLSKLPIKGDWNKNLYLDADALVAQFLER
jgi:CRISPR-associated helicase Cas3